MKKGIIVSIIIGMLGMVQSGMGADEKRSADHDALRALKDKVEKSINAADMNTLRTCMAKDFTFITPDQKVFTKWDDVAAYWDNMFKDKKSPVKAMTTKCKAEILTKFLGPDTGYCRGTSEDIYTLSNKRKVAISNVWSTVLVKEGGAWKISSAHVGVNYLDNPVLSARDMSWFGRTCVALKLRKLPGEVKE